MKTYGYARVSTRTQRLDRQIDNIMKAFPNIKEEHFFSEKYTGTKTAGRTQFKKMLEKVKTGDTIVFDSVSRMSRNAEEGIVTYLDLYAKGVNLVFLKEPHINTDTYKKALSNNIQMTGTNADIILKAVNEYLMTLAKEQIFIAFGQAEKEVKDLHDRVSEGMKATQRKNLQLPPEERKQIGQTSGAKLTTKKSIEMKKVILAKSKDFNGTNNDIDCMKITGLSRNTYYKYKRELFEQGVE